MKNWQIRLVVAAGSLPALTATKKVASTFSFTSARLMVTARRGGMRVSDKLTKDEAIRLHREMWDWLSENPDKEKVDCPTIEKWLEDNEDYPDSDCFCCEYNLVQTYEYEEEGCAHCPLKWPSKETAFQCERNSGLYKRWAYSDDPLERAALAAQIRDLPVREEC